MGKHAEKFRNLAAHFFSDSHLFHPQNGAAAKHLLMLYATRAPYIVENGDTIDFDEITALLKGKGMAVEEFPRKIKDLLEEIGAAEIHLRQIDTLLWHAAEGRNVVVIGGNHDPGFDRLAGENIHGITCKTEDIYDAGKKRGRFLVEHGHRFDPAFLQHYSGLYGIGSRILSHGLRIDQGISVVVPSLREAFPVSNALKALGKQYVKSFRRKAIDKVVETQMDGIICGHIHRQDQRNIKIFKGAKEKRLYINSGDGLTHGTSSAHTEDGEWIDLKAKHVPAKACAILAARNPLRQFRAHSLRFLQAAWDAQLQTLPRAATAEANSAQTRKTPDLRLVG